MIFESEQEQKLISELIDVVLKAGGLVNLNAANYLVAQLKNPLKVPAPKNEVANVPKDPQPKTSTLP